MELKKGIPVDLGSIKGFVFGGPFRRYVPGTRRLAGVKMAAEISHPHEISIPTEDFCVPDVGDMKNGLLLALHELAKGNDIYAGCMGGIGRTGLFMGCMAKLCMDYHGGTYLGHSDPVKFVREHYIPHALETEEQQDYARTFDTDQALEWLKKHNEPVVQVKEVTVERRTVEFVDRPISLSPWQWMADWWKAFFSR